MKQKRLEPKQPDPVRTLPSLVTSAIHGAAHRRIHPILAVSLLLMVASVLASAVVFHAERSFDPAGGARVLGTSTPAPLTLVSNRSLRLTVVPVNYTESGTWTYRTEWRRTLNRVGSIRISLKSDPSNVLLSIPQAPRETIPAVEPALTPDVRYRIEFFSQPNFQGPLLARKFFTAASRPDEPIAMCDYAAPPAGCSYVRGDHFNPVTQCGLELRCGASSTTTSTEPVFCTMDAKICPDGSAVGRRGPNCEFAPCPSPTGSSTPACVPRPACLDSGPVRCLPPEPAAGWCERPICPQVLCAAPPAGYHYERSSGQVCGCGQLVPDATSSEDSITVLSPNGGENWLRGSTQTIRWRGPSPVRIELVPGEPCNADGRQCLIADPPPILIAAAATGGSYRWTVNDTNSATGLILATSRYKIRISGPVDRCTNSVPAHCYGPVDESNQPFTLRTDGTFMSCDYAAPPAGCTYRFGDETDPTTGCKIPTTICTRGE